MGMVNVGQRKVTSGEGEGRGGGGGGGGGRRQSGRVKEIKSKASI